MREAAPGSCRAVEPYTAGPQAAVLFTPGRGAGRGGAADLERHERRRQCGSTATVCHQCDEGPWAVGTGRDEPSCNECPLPCHCVAVATGSRLVAATRDCPRKPRLRVQIHLETQREHCGLLRGCFRSFLSVPWVPCPEHLLITAPCRRLTQQSASNTAAGPGLAQASSRQPAAPGAQVGPSRVAPTLHGGTNAALISRRSEGALSV